VEGAVIWGVRAASAATHPRRKYAPGLRCCRWPGHYASPAGACSKRIFGSSGCKRSLIIRLRRPVGDALRDGAGKSTPPLPRLSPVFCPTTLYDCAFEEDDDGVRGGLAAVSQQPAGELKVIVVQVSNDQLWHLKVPQKVYIYWGTSKSALVGIHILGHLKSAPIGIQLGALRKSATNWLLLGAL
jgi:hypothetical protein